MFFVRVIVIATSSFFCIGVFAAAPAMSKPCEGQSSEVQEPSTTAYALGLEEKPRRVCFVGDVEKDPHFLAQVLLRKRAVDEASVRPVCGEYAAFVRSGNPVRKKDLRDRFSHQKVSSVRAQELAEWERIKNTKEEKTVIVFYQLVELDGNQLDFLRLTFSNEENSSELLSDYAKKVQTSLDEYNLFIRNHSISYGAFIPVDLRVQKKKLEDSLVFARAVYQNALVIYNLARQRKESEERQREPFS